MTNLIVFSLNETLALWIAPHSSIYRSPCGLFSSSASASSRIRCLIVGLAMLSSSWLPLLELDRIRGFIAPQGVVLMGSANLQGARPASPSATRVDRRLRGFVLQHVLQYESTRTGRRPRASISAAAYSIARVPPWCDFRLPLTTAMIRVTRNCTGTTSRRHNSSTARSSSVGASAIMLQIGCRSGQDERSSIAAPSPHVIRIVWRLDDR